MSQLLHFRLLIISTILLGSTIFYSCNKDTSISLGTEDESIGVITVDSMTVFSSTYQLLHMPSAGTGSVLIGKSTQVDIGSVISSSYTALIFETLTNDIPKDAVYQSIDLVLRPAADRYYYGDTTKVQKIAVHRVTEEIKTQNITTGIDTYNTPVYVTGATIFNNQKFNYDSTPLGSGSFMPNVRSMDSIAVNLDTNFGKELFDKVVSNDWDVISHEAFLKYLKGIVVVPDAKNTVILGLNDTVHVNLNYSYIGEDGFKKMGKKSIVTASPSLQFNNMQYDRANTPYAGINATNREIKSTATKGKVLIQSGTGLVAKLDIPSLNEFVRDPSIAINKIQLIVETTGKNYGFYPNPNALMLLIANSGGVPVSYVTNPFSNAIQTATFFPGNESGVNGYYVFNLLEYVKNINSPTYKGTSLLLSTSSPALFSTANAAFIATENDKPKIKLNIVYTKFK